MSFEIRLTRLDDVALLPAVERSAAQAFLATPGLEWIAEDQVCSEQTHRVFVDVGTSWVAVNETGAIIGFVIVELSRRTAHIVEIVVRQDMQGQGCGTALMTAVIDWARTRRLDTLTLTTFIDVPWNAPFYARLGFEIVERKSDPRLDDILRREIARGLPAKRRCAMRLELTR